MDKLLRKPRIHQVTTAAQSRLFRVESVTLEFSNGEQRVYERLQPARGESVMIVPIIDQHLLLMREYAVGIESYDLGFSKGLMEEGEDVYQAANREMQEELGFAARQLTLLKTLTIAPSYFSSRMNIVLAEDLYPQSRQGDEPEPLRQLRWPLAQMMELLSQPDFTEARNISALFLLREWLLAQGRLPASVSG